MLILAYKDLKDDVVSTLKTTVYPSKFLVLYLSLSVYDLL